MNLLVIQKKFKSNSKDKKRLLVKKETRKSPFLSFINNQKDYENVFKVFSCFTKNDTKNYGNVFRVFSWLPKNYTKDSDKNLIVYCVIFNKHRKAKKKFSLFYASKTMKNVSKCFSLFVSFSKNTKDYALSQKKS